MDPIINRIIEYLEDGEKPKDFIIGARTFIKMNECMVCYHIGTCPAYSNGSDDYDITILQAEPTRFLFNHCRFNPNCIEVAKRSLIRHKNYFGYVVENDRHASLLPKNKKVRFNY